MANSKQMRKKSPVGKIILFIFEILLLVALLVVLWVVLKATDETTGVDRITINEDEIKIEMNETVQQNEVMKGYRNIALFGVDSRSGNLKTGTRSDTIIVASINLETKDVKLLSVYRDSYLNVNPSSDSALHRYEKCNAGYAYGGAEQAIRMLNANLDLDITDFVTIGFIGLKDVIDALGGVYIEVDETELLHINNYQISMVKEVDGIDSYKSVTDTGYQLLDGLQAVAYCRIRYTAGSDFKRTERQREVIKACLDKAKTASPSALAKICNNVFSELYTSLDITEVLDLLGSITEYNVVDEGGFPQYPSGLSIKVVGSGAECIIPETLESNVQWLHSFLFEEENYEVSSTVKDYSDRIIVDTAQYTAK
ncbi:MAG: LCP family protein [Lachnospiraceae bacterium]|nr:LCP family protein [Lachnospiraceae bacterium]